MCDKMTNKDFDKENCKRKTQERNLTEKTNITLRQTRGWQMNHEEILNEKTRIVKMQKWQFDKLNNIEKNKKI